MNNKFKNHLTLTALLLTGGMQQSMAKELTEQEDFAMALRALPEAADDLDNPALNKSSAIRMKCFVDTPAYDLYKYDFCISAGAARTTTAVFKVDNVPAGSTISWSNSNCNSNNSLCFVPIRQYQTITVNATVLKPNGTYTTVSATATYEGLF